MNAAAARRPRARDARLLVIDESGLITHRSHRDLPSLLRPGDLVVANDAATIPASLTGVHVRSGAAIEVRLAAAHASTFTAVVFGEGDHRTPTEHRPAPPLLHAGDALLVASLHGRITRLCHHPRLIQLVFEDSPAIVWARLSRQGRPIQYAHVPQPLAMWDTWTSIAARPVAFEAPSAGFLVDWSLLAALRRGGVRFATLTHAAGISSTGDPDLDAQLPFDEHYAIPASTAALLERTKAEGGRVVAIGTTVVRAIEHSAKATGHAVAGDSVATGRIGPDTPLRVVDAVVSGVHEPGTSHHTLLRAFGDETTLGRMWEEAERHGYLAHEFGDAALIVRRDAGLQNLAA